MSIVMYGIVIVLTIIMVYGFHGLLFLLKTKHLRLGKIDLSGLIDNKNSLLDQVNEKELFKYIETKLNNIYGRSILVVEASHGVDFKNTYLSYIRDNVLEVDFDRLSKNVSMRKGYRTDNMEVKHKYILADISNVFGTPERLTMLAEIRYTGRSDEEGISDVNIDMRYPLAAPFKSRWPKWVIRWHIDRCNLFDASIQKIMNTIAYTLVKNHYQLAYIDKITIGHN